MDNYSRSRSSREDYARNQQPISMYDLRSYSTSDYNPSTSQNQNSYNNNNFKEMVKGKKGSKSSKGFTIDPELQRKKRVAGYKAYGVEGRLKNSFRKSFRWIKDVVVHGFW
ncbi:uncharacterized protein LOC127239267 [Andrographis paniculata]|uniref:uncharacterized protein LOC127239267 n=1 Tax=Andrographis paniculata TaxID=175694 RepID=UPI0021E7249E|nr:uncharacterized protein LOC127239267 [Andrographis paniculata]